MSNLLHDLMISRSNSMARIYNVEYFNRISQYIFSLFLSQLSTELFDHAVSTCYRNTRNFGAAYREEFQRYCNIIIHLREFTLWWYISLSQISEFSPWWETLHLFLTFCVSECLCWLHGAVYAIMQVLGYVFDYRSAVALVQLEMVWFPWWYFTLLLLVCIVCNVMITSFLPPFGTE